MTARNLACGLQSTEGYAWVEFFDALENVFYFLSALYDEMYFLAPRVHNFPALAGVLRLSTKYLVEPLRAPHLMHLHCDWPTPLSAWDARKAAANPSGCILTFSGAGMGWKWVNIIEN
ncbi:hypothetical protein BD779DRAFT_1473851 [Infundibulicybe gibba]|nr:hypothetical protein BD779DRAFT_1482530 [Infundibulicybe gibba]KAF8880391.1 hypothetical protein BD779DRAFT_1473851 [Infundibulicybe gibba]